MRAKIDKVKLGELLAQGKSQAHCARIFNVSEMAISKAVRRFSITVAKRVAGKKEARELVKRKITAMDVLMEDLLNLRDKLNWIEDNKPLTAKTMKQGWLDKVLGIIGESRRLVATMTDVRIKIYSVEKVEKALMIMYEEIGKESIELQKRIRDGLRRAAIDLELDG